ncbi:CLUMA_CG005575, isoform A [Clunio marinus]|uniref:Serine palmitoyltransferase small subunit B n=1 Tax=Clunio marinus TaxID=568069 RepID=A0A1J1HVH1_9DIPT|nr:CLUMA_CG005575, isoform A [Clunio marinus]
MDTIKKWFSLLYLRYEIVTCASMFEPWEKIFINVVIFSSLLLLIVSSCIFLPNYLSYLLELFGLTSDRPDTGFREIKT